MFRAAIILALLGIAVAYLTVYGPAEGFDDGLKLTPSIYGIDKGLEPFAEQLGDDKAGYTGHLVRTFHIFRALELQAAQAGEDVQRVQDEVLVAVLVAHDLGLFTEGHWDYLPPSIELLKQQWDLSPELLEMAVLMVDNHHKLTPYTGKFAEPVERFRQADLVDVSFGLYNAGLDRRYLRRLRQVIPEAGFHTGLAKYTLTSLKSDHAWPPLPMYKW